MDNFYKRLKNIRNQHNLSQKKLAEELGYARTTISNYEQNIRIPSLQTITEIADYFNVSVDYLLGRTKIKNTFQDLILNKMQVPVLLIDSESYKIIDFNEKALNYYKYQKHQLNYKSIFKINKSNKTIVKTKIKKAIKNQSYSANFVHQLADGKLRDVIVFYQTIEINAKKIIHATIFDFDAPANIIFNLNKVSKIFLKIFNSKLPFLNEHHENVRKVANLIANNLNLDTKTTNLIEQSAKIHDIGSLLLPTELLYKENLTKNEYKIIKEHPNYGYELFNCLNKDIAEIIKQHHERIDGSGYPQKLKQNQIKKEAKILAVAEVFASMNNNRPYRKKPGFKEACLELKRESGIKYDKKVVETCLKIAENNGFYFLKK